MLNIYVANEPAKIKAGTNPKLGTKKICIYVCISVYVSRVSPGGEVISI